MDSCKKYSYPLLIHSSHIHSSKITEAHISSSNKIYRVEISICHNSINLTLLHKNEEKSDGNINWTKSRSHLIRNFISLLLLLLCSNISVGQRVNGEWERCEAKWMITFYLTIVSMRIWAHHVSHPTFSISSRILENCPHTYINPHGKKRALSKFHLQLRVDFVTKKSWLEVRCGLIQAFILGFWLN